MVASDTSWHSSQESLLKDLAQRCISRSVLHRIEYAHYYRINTGITIPTIVISLLAGAASAAQSTLVEIVGEGAESHVPLVIGMLSMLISILNSVSSFLKIPALTEQNLQSHLQFEKLSRQIQAEICVRAVDRKLSGREACQKFEAAFQQLLDLSPPVSTKTERKFTNRRDVRNLHVPVPHTIKMTKLRTYTEMERDRKRELELEKVNVAKQLHPEANNPRRRSKRKHNRQPDEASPRTRVSPTVENLFQEPEEPVLLKREVRAASAATKPEVLDEIRQLQGLNVVRNFKEGRLQKEPSTESETEMDEWSSANSEIKRCEQCDE